MSQKSGTDLKNAPAPTGGSKPSGLPDPNSMEVPKGEDSIASLDSLTDDQKARAKHELEAVRLRAKEEGKQEQRGEKDSSLKIKIELDLDVEVHLTARVKGYITIGLLVDKGLKRLAESMEEFGKISDEIPKVTLHLNY